MHPDPFAYASKLWNELSQKPPGMYATELAVILQHMLLANRTLTDLGPDATPDGIRKLLQGAVYYGDAAVYWTYVQQETDHEMRCLWTACMDMVLISTNRVRADIGVTDAMVDAELQKGRP
jgi:hypothetical protein